MDFPLEIGKRHAGAKDKRPSDGPSGPLEICSSNVEALVAENFLPSKIDTRKFLHLSVFGRILPEQETTLQICHGIQRRFNNALTFHLIDQTTSQSPSCLRS